MRRTLAVAAVVVVAVIAAWALLRSGQHLPAGAPAPGPAPATRNVPSAQPPPPAASSESDLVSDIETKGLTPERAEWLFSTVIGPLPGVDIPPAFKRDLKVFDGSPAINALYREWNALTPEQQQAAHALIDPPEARPLQPRSAQLRLLGPSVVRAAMVNQTPAFDYAALAMNGNMALNQHLGGSPINFYVMVDYGPPPGIAWAETDSWVLVNQQWQPNPGGCRILVWDQQFIGLTQTDALSTMTHEMMHCYQQRAEGSKAANLSVPDWITEGEAMWAMNTLVPAASDTALEDAWNWYVFRPKFTYVQRFWDSIGTFGHLSDLAGDDLVWGKLLPVALKGIGHDDNDSFALLIQGNEDSYLSSWGSSYFVDGLHVPWNIKGPGSPPTHGPSPDAIQIYQGSQDVVTADPYTVQLSSADGSADIAYISLISGYARVHDGTYGVDTALSDSGPLALCLKEGGCTCPDGTDGASLKTTRADPPLSIGLEGGAPGGQLVVTGASLDDFCKQHQKPQPSPAPGSGSGGGGGGGGGGGSNNNPAPDNGSHNGDSWGDPHVTTFDGATYDFQTVGEYTLARSTTGDLLVQVRQVPVLGSKMASVNKAVAMRVGGQRVTVTLENDKEVLRVDGKEIAGDLPRLKAGSITRSLSMYGTSYQVTWPDSTAVRVAQVGGAALNVSVRPAKSRKGTLEGLLTTGPSPGATQASGRASQLDATARRALADRWRVTQGASLFDYLPGQSAATFTDPTFPSADPNAARVANPAAAEQACRAQGITDKRLLDDCVYDLAVTNNFLFNSSYAYAQRVMNAGARVAMGGAEAARPPQMFKGAIATKTDRQKLRFQAQAGDVVWIGQPGCDDGHGQVLVGIQRPSEDYLAGGAPGCFLGRLVLPDSGTYTLVATMSPAADHLPIPYAVPIEFVRRDRHRNVSYGDLISGTIDARAAHDFFTFSGHAGDVIRLSGNGCDLGTSFTAIVYPDGSNVGGPQCREGSDVQLQKDGTFMLEVNPNDTGPSSYHFVLQGAPGTVPRPR